MTSTTMSSRLNFTKSVMVRSAVDHSTEQHHTYNDDASNWRKIIFLPHQMLWRMMMVTTILIDCCIVTYSLNYSESLSLAQIVLYYMCECMYFVDVVLTILHKYMTAFRQTEVHLPKNTYFMVIDVFTLLPYYEIYYLLRRTSKGKASTFKKDYVKAKQHTWIESYIGGDRRAICDLLFIPNHRLVVVLLVKG
ncbi:hypothetical protein QE152_g34223 [Popillia japonica]|uniref:Ion transport domain-containing protein n=1 Tax=Popillia japonica TaxID=7064 RepID=A0AAW1IUB2_POPJA